MNQPATCDRCGAALTTSYGGQHVVVNERRYETAPDGRTLYSDVVRAVTTCGWTCTAVLAACEAARTADTEAAVLVVAERERQVNAEGWEPGHDDAYPEGHLAIAGLCYLATVGADRGVVADDDRHVGEEGMPPAAWPLEAEWWKPKGLVRDLVRGAALVCAEVDRKLRRRDVVPF